MKLHNLKIKEIFATDVFLGNKTFEVRKNDRDYAVDDIVKFYVLDSKNALIDHPLDKVIFQITYILHAAEFGIEPGYVVFSLKPVSCSQNGDQRGE